VGEAAYGTIAPTMLSDFYPVIMIAVVVGGGGVVGVGDFGVFVGALFVIILTFILSLLFLLLLLSLMCIAFYSNFESIYDTNVYYILFLSCSLFYFRNNYVCFRIRLRYYLFNTSIVSSHLCS
jgi:hypothetical protein